MSIAACGTSAVRVISIQDRVEPNHTGRSKHSMSGPAERRIGSDMNEQKSSGKKTIALNKRARFEYHIEERLEAGISLEGWEVKALREGRVQFADSYVLLKDNEAFLFGCQINPLPTASTHIRPDPVRTRKLLLQRREIDRLTGAVDRKGFTVVPTAMYWSRGKVKVEIGLAKGKQQHDKRKTQKDRDWERQKGRIMKRG
jgi:SsrA-binding protein